jgi:assimilatory nitrate reductase electron transfer subunit
MRRVVIIGYGMAGARLAELIRHRDPTGERVAVTAIGEEKHRPYNRVLLSGVVAGSMPPEAIALQDADWAVEHDVDLRLGIGAVAVNRAARTVVLTDGSTVDYDVAVLATGARSWLPPVAGLTCPKGELAPGVVAFRTLDDCVRIRHAARAGTSGATGNAGESGKTGTGGMTGAGGAGVTGGGLAGVGGAAGTGGAGTAGGLSGGAGDGFADAGGAGIAGGGAGDGFAGAGGGDLAAGVAMAVLGGGLLGLEVACALARGGSRVTVVHPVGHLMERQLDSAAGDVLAKVLSGLGIDVRLSSPVSRYVPGLGLELADGGWIRADHVVVSAGVRPETGLAERAGLTVDRGIVVDDALLTSDPCVHAVGDCAQHPRTVSGLVQPAWEQAAVLADIVTGADTAARYRGTPVVTRLKALDVDLVALGDTQVRLDAADADVLCLTDFNGGRYAKLVIRNEKVSGAIVLGVPSSAAAITQLYDRGMPVPDDRLPLLLGRTMAEADTGVVCRCNAVTRTALQDAWRHGAHSVAELAAETRATTGCGSCHDEIDRLSHQWSADA